MRRHLVVALAVSLLPVAVTAGSPDNEISYGIPKEIALGKIVGS
jgi:hypothetical protein